MYGGSALIGTFLGIAFLGVIPIIIVIEAIIAFIYGMYKGR